MDQKIILKHKIKITSMKTQEQIKQDIVSYLTKTSTHTFIKPKANFKWGSYSTPGYYEYDYNDFTYFKVIEKEDGFYCLEGNRLSKIDIDSKIKYWGNNAKCVLIHSLFLNKKMRSVKSNKYHLEEIDKILKSIK